MEQRKENKMGTMPIGPLLIDMSLPMMISMLVQAMYNIIDSIFVSRIGEDALTAVSLAFPLQSLMIAVCAGTGVGVNSLLSRSLGAHKYEKANRTAINGIFIYGLSYFVFLIIGFTAVKPFYAAQLKGTESDIYTFGVQYLSIVLMCSFGIFAQFIFERLLQATGRTFFSMISQLCGAITNIILDPILIFGWFGLPKLGVAGAAIATVLGQVIGATVAIVLNFTKNHDIKISFKGFRPDLEIIGGIYKVGIPSIIMQAIGSIMTYTMNMILIAFSSTATAVFGVYFKLQSFFFMPVFGLNNGMIPIIAFNYGAKNKTRMLKTIKLGMVAAFVFMVLGVAVFNLIPATLLGLFDASEEMIAIGVPALRIISIHFLLAWLGITLSGAFQALGNGVYSLVVSLTRQLVVLLPAAFILSKVGGLAAVWWAFPIAEIVSATCSVVFFVNMYHKVIKPIGSEQVEMSK